jgi:hypothetical protein
MRDDIVSLCSDNAMNKKAIVDVVLRYVLRRLFRSVVAWFFVVGRGGGDGERLMKWRKGMTENGWDV